MGLDNSVLAHLKYCKQYGDFKDTITLGRQKIHTNTQSFCNGKSYDGYCEDLLITEFGSTFVDSMDASNYEESTIIHDLNKKITSKKLVEKYDTVLDFGTLEHVYHINNAFYNVSRLCKPGGQIIHVLPSNQFCGHGFWQMSPELFFSLYTEKNGYMNTEVFAFNVSNHSEFHKLSPPSNGKRLLITSNNQLYSAVRTVRCNVEFFHDNVQQSDYSYLWENSKK